MIVLLHLLGLGWTLAHGGFWLIHMAIAVGAVYVLFEKGYVITARGFFLAAVCFLDAGIGVLVALLLPTWPVPKPQRDPFYPPV